LAPASCAAKSHAAHCKKGGIVKNHNLTWKKWTIGALFVLLVLAIEFFLVAPFFMDGRIKGSLADDVEAPPSGAPACARVVEVLENQLKKVGESEASDYLERAKIQNRLSLEACTEDAKQKYFNRAISDLQVADALRLLNAPMTDINQKVGFYWKERAEFFRLHGQADREIEIYEKYLSIPGRGRDVYSMVKKAEVFVRIGRLNDAVAVYADVAEICRTANNSNCYIAGAQFADLLEENADNQEIIGDLSRKWSKESDRKDLFRFNGDAAARIRSMLK
jgi:tetratricopeptide (TPR) repeat protein